MRHALTGQLIELPGRRGTRSELGARFTLGLRALREHRPPTMSSRVV